MYCIGETSWVPTLPEGRSVFSLYSLKYVHPRHRLIQTSRQTLRNLASRQFVLTWCPALVTVFPCHVAKFLELSICISYSLM